MSEIKISREGRRVWITLPLGSPVKSAIKGLGAHWHPETKRWWIGTGKADQVQAIIDAHTATAASRTDPETERRIKRAAARAEDIFSQISAGKVVFTNGPVGWLIVGPADAMGADVVVVTRKDGTETRVRVRDRQPVLEKRGLRYMVADFATVATAAESGDFEVDRSYTLKHDSAFGTGRVYRDSPGATHYDDGSGSYRIQIWDQ